MRKRYSFVTLVVLLSFILTSSSSIAEMDKTRKMKAEAQYYFDKGEYYNAIDIWAEVLKIDSYDKEALQGITKAQEIIEKEKGEEEKREREKLRELIQEGKNYYRDRDYKKALSSWGQALSIDPTNKEVLDLIEEARIKAQYQITILDKLEREKRLKTPYVEDLDKIADKMINLLEKADVRVRKEKREEIEEAEVVAKVEEEKEFITTTFSKGEELYKEERFKEAITEWNKILPYLPKSSQIAIKIAELKERIAAEEELRRKEEIERRKKEEEERRRLEEEAKRKKKLEEEKEKIRIEKERVRERRFPRRPSFAKALEGKQDLLIIGIIILLALLLIIKITTRRKGKAPLAKAPPKKAKKEEEFEPRDLKEFLKKKKEDKDKDLFK